jgi:hypothetical protein
MPGFKTYNADEVKISIAGIPINSGYADGEFLRIERDTPAFEDVVGTDGEVTRSKTKDNRATATLLLMQTSDGNNLLSALHNTDKASPGGAGVGPFLVEDLNGLTIHEAAECWVQGSAPSTYDRTPTAREWPIRIANLIDFIAGT